MNRDDVIKHQLEIEEKEYLTSHIKLTDEKTIIQPATNVSDRNVTWRADAEINVPASHNIGYNLTMVSVWVTHNMSPLETNTPFGVIGQNYTSSSINPTGIINSSGDGIGYYAHIGGTLSVFLLFNMFFKFEDKQELVKGLFVNMLLLLVLLAFLFFF